jgi:hypothetical protein
MANTLGYHLVKSAYGQWLPGDERGSWSDAWDDQIGYIEPHMLHPGDPIRHRMAEERMKHDPMRLSNVMIDIVAATLGECIKTSAGGLIYGCCNRANPYTSYHSLQRTRY